MAVARSKVYRFFPIDTSADISADLVELSLDQSTWLAATHNAPDSNVQVQYAIDHPVKLNLTRQWVRILSGPTETFAPSYGEQKVHGRVTDNPEIPYLAWDLHIDKD